MTNKVETVVRKLLREAAVHEPPVDVETLARSQGVAVTYQPLPAGADDLSGCFVHTPDGRYIIGVNAAHHPNRQRFTVAHELGHFLLHQDSVDDVHVDGVFLRDQRSAAVVEPIEIEANAFAASLLMPEAMLKKDLARLEGLDDEEQVRALARRYAVSVQAMTLRLVNLGVFRVESHE